MDKRQYISPSENDGEDVNCKEEYLNLFKLLNENSISFCLLRDDLDNELSKLKDLDLLVSESSFELVVEKLTQCDYLIKTTVKQLIFKTVLVKLMDDGVVTIDLHYKAVQNGIVYMDAEKILSECKEKNSWYIPNDIDLLMILVFHNLLGKGGIQNKHLELIKKLSAQYTDHEITSYHNTYKTTPILIEVLNNINCFLYKEGEKNIEVFELAKHLKKEINKTQGLSTKKATRFRFNLLLRSINIFPKAPIYAAIGVDGVGKSTLIDTLVNEINSTHVLSADTIYMGPWGHYLKFDGVGAPYTPGWSVSRREWLDGLLKPEVSRVRITLRFIRSCYFSSKFFVLLMLEMLYRYFKAYKLRRRGVVVITDRYIYDLMTGSMHQIVPHFKRTRSFVCDVFFRPTKVFWLTNEVDTILERKQDLTKEQLIKFINVYQESCEKYNFEKVPTIESADLISKKLLRENFEEIINMARV